MKRSRFWKKTVSMVLACAMLGTTFAQCAIAEEAFETEAVVAIEETTPAEETAASTVGTPEDQKGPEAEEPVAEESVTEVPVAEGPVMEEPVTEVPAVEEPVTEAPVAETPVAEEPVMEVPEAEVPAVEEPVTEAPVAEEPVTEAPVAEEPVTEAPAVEEPVIEAPVAEEPVTEAPAVGEPVTEAFATAESQTEVSEADNDAADISVGDDALTNTIADGFLESEDEYDAYTTSFIEDIEPTVGVIDAAAAAPVAESEAKTYGDGKNGTFTYVDCGEEGKEVKITAWSGSVSGSSLVIPDEITETSESGTIIKKVTEIGDRVFRNKMIAGGLELPGYLKTIGNAAFEGCNMTGALELPDTLQSIGQSAFKNCKFSGKLNLPASLTSIGESAFAGCSNLTGTLEIPAAVTELEASAFKNCSGITGLAFKTTGLAMIGDSAFEGCSLSGTLALPGGVTYIGENAFINAGFTGALALPSSVTEVGGNAFKGCIGFGSVSLSASLEVIGESAFEGCTGLANNGLAPSGSLKMIRKSAFSGCSGMTGELNLSALDNPYIEENAFSGCTGFTSLSLPANTSQIHKQAVFDTICVEEPGTKTEVQDGETFELPKIYAWDGKLELLNRTTWTAPAPTSSVSIAVSSDGNTATASGSGEVTLTATAYNGMTATKTFVVVASENGATDNVAPTIRSIWAVEGQVWRPGIFKLSAYFVESGSGVVAISGNFCKKDDINQKIGFSCDWTGKRKFTGTTSDISVDVPLGAAAGSYYLSDVKLKDESGNETSYTYNPTTKKWKSANGNTVTLTANVEMNVLDRFGKDGITSKYITNKTGIVDSLNKTGSLIITYDAGNHTVSKNWLNNQNMTKLILSSGAIEWSVLKKEISTASKNFNCLVTVEKKDTAIYGNTAASMAVSFGGIRSLPGKVTLRIRADQMNDLYNQTKKIYVYSVGKKGLLKPQNIAVSYVSANGQDWYEFAVSNTTPARLIMSGKEMNLKPASDVTSITLNKTTLNLSVGQTAKLKATVGPDTALNKKIKWVSSNKKIATVDAKGKITAKKYGKVTIKAKAKDGSGVVAKCKLTVGYKIKYKLKGGKNNKNNPKSYYKTAVVLKDPTKKGYRFAGWYTDKNYLHKIRLIPKSYMRDMTLYAKWEKK